MISTKDIAWLAGLLEGEGHFRLLRNSPCIQLSMTDRDVIQKAANLLGRSVYGPYRAGRVGEKPVFAVHCWGSKAASWLMTIYVFMGSRRKEAIQRVLEKWRTTFAKSLGQKKPTTCGHSSRPHRARGLCGSCYNRAWAKGDIPE